MPLFVFYSNKKKNPGNIFAIKTTWADANAFKKNKKWSKSPFGMTLPGRHYEEITFTGENRLDKIKLDFAHIRVKEILRRKDTLHGLHFRFEQDAEYWTFIKSIDILKFEGARHFWPVDREIWFFYLRPTLTRTDVSGFLMECDNVENDTPLASCWSKFAKQVETHWRYAWEIILAFLCFLLSVWIIRRYNNGC